MIFLKQGDISTVAQLSGKRKARYAGANYGNAFHDIEAPAALVLNMNKGQGT